MGTAFRFDVRDPRFHAASLDGAVAWLHWVERTFDPRRADSAVSLLAAGRIEFDDCPDEVGEVFDLCAAVEAETAGFFSPLYADRLDPAGLVKGWAVERASEMLSQAGSRSHCVTGGGDVRAVGEPTRGAPWRIGIADPVRPGELATTVLGRDFAVATSGSADHESGIVDPHTHRAASGAVASVTVVGPDLIRADAYATAAVAMGDRAYAWLSSLPEHTAVVVGLDGTLWRTPGPVTA